MIKLYNYFKKKGSRLLFIYVALLSLFFAINYSIFKTFWSSPVVSGWDGASHAAIGYYYATNIFPKTWGWVPYWFSGMPFPNFYPPMFYIILAFFYKILPFSYDHIFKALIIICESIIPLLIATLSYRLYKNYFAALLSGITAIIYLSSLDQVQGGVTVAGSLTGGDYTQLLGFVFFLCWLYVFLHRKEQKKYFYGSLVFLVCILLTNVHIVPSTLIIMAVDLLFEIINNRKNISGIYNIILIVREYLIIGMLALLLCAFWYVPMLAHYHYVVGKPVAKGLTIDVFSFIYEYFWTVCIVVGGLWLSFNDSSRSSKIISWSSAVNLLLIFFWPTALFPKIIVQTYRWIPVVVLLDSIIIGYIVERVSHKRSNIKYFFFAFIILYIITSIGFVLFDRHYYFKYEGFYIPTANDNLSVIIDELKKLPKGMVMIEVATRLHEPQSQAINALLGVNNIQTSFTAFRESSLSVLSLVPSNDILSVDQEDWGIDSFLINDKYFQSMPIDQKIRTADFLGVRYLLIRSTTFKNDLEKSPNVRVIRDYGMWQLYEINDRSSQAFVPVYKPFAVFAKENFKSRQVTDYDFTRFAEGQMLNRAFDLTLVSKDSQSLDNTSDWANYSGLIISNYRYSNIVNTLANLEAYSKDHIIVAINNGDKLAQALENLHNSHIIVLDKPAEYPNGWEDTDWQLNTIFTFLNLYKQSEPNQQVVTLDTADSSIVVSLASSTSLSVPIVIKTSYFPWWQTNQGHVSLVAPSFMMVETSKKIELDYTPDISLIVGYCLTFGTAVLIAVWICRSKILALKD